MNSLDLDAVDCATILEALTPGFETKTLYLAASIQKYTLADAIAAYERVLDRTSSHTIVLTPNSR